MSKEDRRAMLFTTGIDYSRPNADLALDTFGMARYAILSMLCGNASRDFGASFDRMNAAVKARGRWTDGAGAPYVLDGAAEVAAMLGARYQKKVRHIYTRECLASLADLDSMDARRAVLRFIRAELNRGASRRGAWHIDSLEQYTRQSADGGEYVDNFGGGYTIVSNPDEVRHIVNGNTDSQLAALIERAGLTKAERRTAALMPYYGTGEIARRTGRSEDYTSHVVCRTRGKLSAAAMAVAKEGGHNELAAIYAEQVKREADRERELTARKAAADEARRVEKRQTIKDAAARLERLAAWQIDRAERAHMTDAERKAAAEQTRARAEEWTAAEVARLNLREADGGAVTWQSAAEAEAARVERQTVKREEWQTAEYAALLAERAAAIDAAREAEADRRAEQDAERRAAELSKAEQRARLARYLAAADAETVGRTFDEFAAETERKAAADAERAAERAAVSDYWTARAAYWQSRGQARAAAVVAEMAKAD